MNSLPLSMQDAVVRLGVAIKRINELEAERDTLTERLRATMNEYNELQFRMKGLEK